MDHDFSYESFLCNNIVTKECEVGWKKITNSLNFALSSSGEWGQGNVNIMDVSVINFLTAVQIPLTFYTILDRLSNFPCKTEKKNKQHTCLRAITKRPWLTVKFLWGLSLIFIIYLFIWQNASERWFRNQAFWRYFALCRRVWFVAKVSVFFVLFSRHCAKCVTDSLTCVCHWNTEVPLRDT